MWCHHLLQELLAKLRFQLSLLILDQSLLSPYNSCSSSELPQFVNIFLFNCSQRDT